MPVRDPLLLEILVTPPAMGLAAVCFGLSYFGVTATTVALGVLGTAAAINVFCNAVFGFKLLSQEYRRSLLGMLSPLPLGLGSALVHSRLTASLLILTAAVIYF